MTYKESGMQASLFNTRHLTKRAPDLRESGAFTRLIQASAVFYPQTVIYALPQAGNANR
jgi:hypothetical protein